MARTGRPPNTVPSRIKGINLPEDLIAKVDLLLLDPARGQAEYGSWAALVSGLLRNWIVEQQRLHNLRPPPLDLQREE